MLRWTSKCSCFILFLLILLPPDVHPWLTRPLPSAKKRKEDTAAAPPLRRKEATTLAPPQPGRPREAKRSVVGRSQPPWPRWLRKC